MNLNTYFIDMWQLALQGDKQGVWFFASLYCFILCSYSVFFQVRTRFWPFTQGELQNVSVNKFGATDWVVSNQEYVAEALYRYSVSDVIYAGSRISPWVFVASHNARAVLNKQLSFVERFPDGSVKVFYNPAKPQKSYLMVAGKAGIFITLLVGNLPLISFYSHYYG
jgi:hypothetical protein